MRDVYDPTRTAIDLVADRAGIVEALVGGPSSPQSLTDRVEASRSTVDRALRELEEAGLVARTADGYTATAAGELLLSARQEYVATAADVLACEDLLEPLAGTDIRERASAVVTGAERYRADGDSPDPLAVLERAAADAKGVRGTHASVRDSDLLERVAPAFSGAEIGATDLVVPPAVYQALTELTDATVADTDRLTVCIGETTPASILLFEAADATTVAVLVYEGGERQGLLVNDTPAAVRWADARIREREADAITVSTHPGDGGANTGSGGAHAGAASVHAPGETADVGPAASLPVALESEGFERLSGT